MKFDTRVVRAGITPDPTTGAIVPPLYQTATFRIDDNSEYDYTRSGNPTRRVVEDQLARVEGGSSAFAFSSGTAATEIRRPARSSAGSRRWSMPKRLQFFESFL